MISVVTCIYKTGMTFPNSERVNGRYNCFLEYIDLLAAYQKVAQHYSRSPFQEVVHHASVAVSRLPQNELSSEKGSAFYSRPIERK
jgi:hypothetical protein